MMLNCPVLLSLLLLFYKLQETTIIITTPTVGYILQKWFQQDLLSHTLFL